MTRLVALTLGAALLALGSTGARLRAEEKSESKSPAEPSGPSALVGEPAPMFLLRTLNPDVAGPRFIFRDHVGPKARFPKKRFLLDFAASWCVPCKDELEKLSRMKEELEKAGIGVAVVVIDDTPEGIATMRELVTDELSVPFPVVSDRFQVLARRYAVEKLPLAVVVGSDGVVLHVQEGFAKGDLGRLRGALGL